VSPWDRRRFLTTLAALPALPVLGCARSSAPGRLAVERGADPRARIAELIASLRAEGEDVTALLHIDDHVSVVESTEHSSLERSHRAHVRITTNRGGEHVEVATDDLGPASLAALTATLRASSGTRATPAAAAPAGASRRWTRAGSTSFREWRDRDLRNRGSELFERVSALRSSRLIRRSVRIDTSETRTYFFGPGAPLEAHVVRDRMQASLVAWTGADVQSASFAAGASGARRAALDAADLAQLEQWALTMVTARRVEAGPKAVLLSPRLAATFIGGCVAPVLDASLRSVDLLRLRALGSERITLVDDPSGPGYGALFFDDDGVPASAAPLIRNGSVVDLLGSDGPARGRRRRGSHGQWSAPPTNLTLSPGTGDEAALISAIDDGMVVDGPIAARIDPLTLDFSLEASRGLGVRRGTLDGRIFGRVTIQGRLDRVLGAVSGLSTRSASIPLITGHGTAVEVAAPAILTDVMVVPG